MPSRFLHLLHRFLELLESIGQSWESPLSVFLLSENVNEFQVLPHLKEKIQLHELLIRQWDLKRQVFQASPLLIHLAEENLKSKRPFRALPLTPEHRQLRLQWCQARSMWNVTYWQKIVFSDEFRLVLGTDDNRVRVWRRPGERYNSPPPIVLRHTALTAGVMVWGAYPMIAGPL
ncbi:hypothetical protein TNCV_3524841 [Trichonephila clavipes]|uniref:Transposase n=1 Tax=Trichonephila clavipes TaxID=2585209 RepID=A0A8X6S898_TRICX|nr:hypothetical protein TNCV_3524841 [Trichonephila clavipes]